MRGRVVARLRRRDGVGDRELMLKLKQEMRISTL